MSVVKLKQKLLHWLNTTDANSKVSQSELKAKKSDKREAWEDTCENKTDELDLTSNWWWCGVRFLTSSIVEKNQSKFLLLLTR